MTHVNIELERALYARTAHEQAAAIRSAIIASALQERGRSRRWINRLVRTVSRHMAKARRIGGPISHVETETLRRACIAAADAVDKVFSSR